MQTLLNAIAKYASQYADHETELPVNATVSRPDLFDRFNTPLPETGTKPEHIIEELIANAEPGLVRSTSGRFFGWVMGGHLPSSLAADWLTSVWDQNAGLYATSPAAAIVEQVTGEWLKQLLGLPTEVSFALTTGCQMAHFTCLAAARHALLKRHGWDVETRGLSGSPRIRILTSPLLHGSAYRAIRFAGLGTGNIEFLDANDEGQLQPEALEKALEGNTSPVIVILQAGDVNTGTFDDFASIAPIAQKHNVWVHIDGAFGLWVATSDAYRHFTKGCALMDSWATDGHKWLNVPYDSGYAFVRDREAHHGAHAYKASYLTHSNDARDPMDWTPEWSRRARAFATYAAIRELGRLGIAELIERCCRLSAMLTNELGKIEGVKIVSDSKINQSLLRFIPPVDNPTREQCNAFTDEIIDRNLREGVSFMGGTDWKGYRCMRISVSNWQTSERDVMQTVAGFRSILAEYNVRLQTSK